LVNLGANIIAVDKYKFSSNKNIDYYYSDFNCTHSLRAALDKIKRNHKNIDILINNAAKQVFSDFRVRRPQDIDEVMNVNIRANIIISQFIFNKYFVKKKTGKIINLGSIYGVVSGDMKLYAANDRKTSEIYGASKAAIIHLTKYLASYMGRYNVTVNCVSPGGVINKKTQKKIFIKNYSKKTAKNSMASIDDIFNALHFFIKDESTYITGHNLIVDGGYTLT